MTILELPKDALLALTDAQLEQLIGRLSEAEVAAHGADVADVRFSGSITAPDGGVDVRVDVKKEQFASGFIRRSNTIFQSKKCSMPAGQITKEMKPKGALAQVIGQQCQRAGAYVIVSLADDCTDELMLKRRLQAMLAAVADHPNKDAIHLDFYDRFKLHQWLRQHPSIMLWVRNVLGQPLAGWQSYGRWSNVPHGVTDDLIMKPGVSVILPNQQHQPLTIEHAITPTRNLISTTNKAIRVAGLSGVGKTRLVQALFDETVGENALDRTSVVYTDTGANPDPSARQMIDQLMQDGRAATVVIDNCPPALHTDLANLITSTENSIKLITVEYDIRDDKPLTTEVIHIEAHGPEIAEALVLRWYPGIGHANARQVAEFSSGNTRIALALADRVEAGESLALLSDTNLFNRLFQQRHETDGQLRAHAEILSLAYSFAVEGVEGEPDELEVLGSIFGATSGQLYASAQILLERQIAQKRGRWRAVLPQAIANRLATSALDRIRIPTLRATFENSDNKRLLKSFSHRLGLMHDHPVAQRIVTAWLSPGGMLVPAIGLDDCMARVLEHVSPVCPDLLLDQIEIEIRDRGFGGFEVRQNSRRTTILNMLVSLAYEPEAFDRCVNLLLLISGYEDTANNYDGVHDKIVQFFQPYLSGTHATMEQRAAIVRTSLWSHDPNLRVLGFGMLSRTLGGPPWSGSGMGDFGARPRDFGFQPNHEQLVAWRKMFMDIALEAGLDTDVDLGNSARIVIAQQFRGLWSQTAVRGRLIEIAVALNEQRAWTEGWKAVQSTICFDYRNTADGANVKPIPPELAELRDCLAPQKLPAIIKTYLFGESHDHWSLDPDFDHDDPEKYAQAAARIAERVTGFGEKFANTDGGIDQLGPQLFSTNWMPYGRAFGAGLARGAHEIMASWTAMVTALRESGVTDINCAVLSGFIEEAGRINEGIDRQILDICLDDPLLRPTILLLHPSHDFTDADLDRCMKALAHPDVGAWSFGKLLWRQEYAALPTANLLELAEMLLEKPNGDEAILDALSMKLHDKDKTIDNLGSELRRIGLLAAIRRIGRERIGNIASIDHHMANVMTACLSRDDNEMEKSAWLDAIFSSVDAHYGSAPGCDKAIQVTAATMTGPFLDRVFSGDEQQRRYRLRFLERGGFRRATLATTDVGRIIEWCHGKGDPTIWEGVASALDLFATTSDEETVSAGYAGIRFVEASPYPEHVLKSYARRITPSGWSGSRANIMERNTNALAVFTQHQNPAIASPAMRIIAEAATWISKERDRERREDEANEQRFE